MGECVGVDTQLFKTPLVTKKNCSNDANLAYKRNPGQINHTREFQGEALEAAVITSNTAAGFASC